MQIEILRDLDGNKKGKIITVTAFKGVPTIKYWRDRLKDAEIDNCVKIHKPKKKEVKK